MENQVNVEAFKQLLGDAMLLGMQLAESGYGGGVGDGKNAPLVEGMARMYESIEAFLAASPMSNVSPEHVMPFCDTIREIRAQAE